MKFKSIEIQGYKSIKHINFKLDRKGVTIMRGKNGSGKSSIFDALYWCLFGKSLKGTKKSSIKPLFNDLETIVTITTDKHIITRTLTSLTIEENGEILNLINIPATEAYIQDLLQVSPKMFLTAILFGQNLQRFSKGTDAEKRTMLEEIFDQVQFVDELQENLTTRYQELKESKQIHTLKISNFEGKLEAKEEQIEALDERIRVFEAERAAAIAISKEQIATLQAESKEIEDFDDSDGAALDDMERTIERLESILNDDESCSQCRRPFDDAAELKEAKKKAKASLAALEPVYAENYLKYTARRKNHNLLVREQERTEQTIAALRQDIRRREDSKYPMSKESLLEEIERVHKNIDLQEDFLEDIDTELEYYQWWISNGFNAKGLKSYLLNDLLTSLTDRLYTYSSITGVEVTMHYDPTKVRKAFQIICSVDEQILDYDELSGGEKVRVDLAISFALNDLVSDNISTNILILDEAFENLDEEGLFAMQELINLKKSKSVYVITHRADMDVLGSKTINVKRKVNGNTKIY